MATVKEINHDSSTTIGVHYDTVTDPDGAVSVTVGAALDSSVYGVEIDYDAGSNAITLLENFAALSGNDFRWRFRLDFSNMAPTGSVSNTMAQFRLTTAASALVFRISIGYTGSDFQATLFYYSDSGGTTTLASANLSSSGDLCIELRAIKETADGNADGEAEWFVDGVSQDSFSNLDNFNRFGVGIAQTDISFSSSDADAVGQLYYDEWILDDVNTADLGCGLSDLGLAAMTKPADIDAAGEFIYVALLEGATPILTKISTALDADGTTVFDPGAGDNIGVECGRFSSDTVWVAGNFDGTNVVEKSEDGGSTFAVKDDGAIGDVRTFVMGPDSDERILVFDETNGDILETNDDGASWTAINAAVTPEVNAIARLGENVQESVFGNDGGANNSINYSVNSGGNLEDFQTGVFPNENVTRVIVN
jgi:hypothetical protein